MKKTKAKVISNGCETVYHFFPLSLMWFERKSKGSCFIQKYINTIEEKTEKGIFSHAALSTVASYKRLVAGWRNWLMNQRYHLCCDFWAFYSTNTPTNQGYI